MGNENGIIYQLIRSAQSLIRLRRIPNRTGALDAIRKEEQIFTRLLSIAAQEVSLEVLFNLPTIRTLLESHLEKPDDI